MFLSRRLLYLARPAAASSQTAAIAHSPSSAVEPIPVRASFPPAALATTAFATALLCCLAAVKGFTATPRAIALGTAPNILMAALFFFYRDHRNEQAVAYIFGALGILIWASYVNAWLAIVGLTTSFPLQDARFMAWSDAVGVDYRAILGWVARHPNFGAMLGAAYPLAVPMIFVAPVVLAVSGQYQRLRTFVLLYAILLTVTVVISIVTPAKGFAVYAPLPADLSQRLPTGASVFYARTMEAYRSGGLRVIDPSHLEGVVVFPSFHTVMVLLAIYAFWRTRFAWAISLAINGVILLSIIPIGGHYVWDVIGATVLFAAAAPFARRWAVEPVAVIRECGAAAGSPA